MKNRSVNRLFAFLQIVIILFGSSGIPMDNSMASTQIPGGLQIINPLDDEETFIEMPVEDGPDAEEESSTSFDKTIVVGQKMDLRNKVFGSIDGDVTRYTVDDKKLASVSKTGILTGKKAGIITVTAQKKTGKTIYEDLGTCDITILSKPRIVFPVPMTYQGQRAEASDFFTTEDTESGLVSLWESSNSSVVNVIDENKGTIEAVGNGTAKITAYFGKKGETGTIKVTASMKVKIPSFRKSEYDMQTGQKLNVTVKNVNTNQDVLWYTEDNEIATASKNVNSNKAIIEGLSYGSTSLIAEIDGIQYRCCINVAEPQLSKTDIHLAIGKTAKIALKNTRLKRSDIVWESSDSNIVSVEATGEIKALQTGEAFVFTKTGGATGVCLVTVGSGRQQSEGNHYYVLNTNTMKFHYPTCGDTLRIDPENYATSTDSREELISQGYSPCGHCKP